MNEYKMYQIYDGENTSLMSEYPEIEAKNSRDAIRMFLLATNRRDYKFKRAGGNDVTFKTTPFILKDGKKHKSGKSIWYKKL